MKIELCKIDGQYRLNSYPGEEKSICYHLPIGYGFQIGETGIFQHGKRCELQNRNGKPVLIGKDKTFFLSCLI